MTERIRGREQLQYPKFGDPPPRSRPQPRAVFRYAEMLHKIREYPGQWAQIAVFEQGPPSKTKSRLQSVTGEVHRYLKRSFPLEVWEISQRSIAGSWNKRELWVRYIGVITVEQAAEMSQARRDLWLKGKANGDKRRAAKETRERIKGMAVNREIAQLQAEQRRYQRES